jgi:predicted nuclease with TOPRIM domain
MNDDQQSEAWFAEQLAELQTRLQRVEQLEADREKSPDKMRGFGPERTALLELIDKLTSQLAHLRSRNGP